MAFGIEKLTEAVKAEGKLVRADLKLGRDAAATQAAAQAAATKENTEVQKRAEQQLIAANERLQNLIDLSSPPPEETKLEFQIGPVSQK